MLDLVVCFCICLSMAIALYPLYMVQKAPRLGISSCLKDSPIPNRGRKRIVLLGDSITQGRIGDSYAEMLHAALGAEYDIVNAGKNGELAWNVLQRIDEVVRCRPDAVLILIGTNDALESLPRGMSPPNWFARIPSSPTLDWFEANLGEIVHTLKTETNARIGVLSIPPLGEVMDHPAFHAARQHTERILAIAKHHDVDYLPLNEKMQSVLKENAGVPKTAFHKSRVLILKSLYKRYLLKKDWNNISADEGFSLFVDHIHPNTEGAKIIADLVSEFIQSV